MINSKIEELEAIVRKGQPYSKRNKTRRIRAIIREMKALQARPWWVKFKEFLRASGLLPIFFFIIFLSSCAYNPEMRPVCRHWAVFTAITYHDYIGCPVRIAVGLMYDTPAMVHAQAQAFVNEKWQWLIFKDGIPQIGEKDPFIPAAYYTVKEFMNEKSAWRNKIYARKH